MQESFIHYLWSLQYFDKRELFTSAGERLELFHPGMLNTDAGPDFSNSRIRIGDINWVGNIEIHTLSSGWLTHHHDEDPAYDSVILHVVWKEDKKITRRDMSPLPTLELQGRVEESLIRSYRQLVGSAFSIPCQRSFIDVESVTRYSMVSKALAQRLERKAREVLALLQLNANSWEETSYQLLARAFGFKINADPFFQLAKSVPLRILQKQGDQLLHVEALLFGQAGFLEYKNGDTYYSKLQLEYRLLAHKYSLAQARMTKSQWRFLRLRPPNFPTLRLAQFSAIVQRRKSVFADIMEANNMEALADFLHVAPSEYWVDHYQFSTKSANRVRELGKGSAEGIIINAVIPLWVAYARRMDDQQFMDRALSVLEKLPPEVNAITRRWVDLGMEPQNSGEAQGLIELFNTFCHRKACLQCTIGASLIRPPDNEHSRIHS